MLNIDKLLEGVTQGPFKALGTLVTTGDGKETFIAEMRDSGSGNAQRHQAMANCALLAASWELAHEVQSLRRENALLSAQLLTHQKKAA